ncbi:L-asparaginase [Oceanospirillum multiglobuliferum]|uniref:asparaginase n=1 Tax=Oceanospirillum multiglobuliferum TaxID=64969 RepID=A0A1T4RWK5_9GAMM|nr:asparaginase [Oceanospirillum multiglobuliferum]OPX54575.1 L-asparaginase 1 [Oceanospirillum multiglobuliferum]SKA20343.1 L-asparaginase [Oceanospirillum multiglobuliferum]
MSAHILILYTGGTIGMIRSARGYVPKEGFEARLAEQLQCQSSDQLPMYSVLEFEQLIDSSNLHPRDWTAIATVITEYWEMYDGFVVLHGTDTMAYTASALSFMLKDLDKPVIVTGSQIPLSELRNDALDNLITSLILAGQQSISEVCIYFNGRLLRGNRSTKLKSVGFDAFDSPNYPWLAEVGIHITLKKELLLKPSTPSFHLFDFNPDAVAMVQMYPGIQAQVVEAVLNSGDVKALILQSYGAGNPPDSNQALMQVLAQASLRGIVIVNISQCLQGGVYQGAYATGETLNQMGVISGHDLTLEAAFTKLHCLISAGYSPYYISELMPTALCGECR